MPTRTPDGFALIDPPGGAPTGRILAGLSGGLDSSVLLHLMRARFGTKVEAVHVHHGLHRDADAWAMHCAAFCALLGVPLHVLRVDVARDGGRGLEHAARDARHAAIAALMQPGDAVVFAHHRDDQAETVLLRALRASGPDGLAAMRPWREFGAGGLWRPLLDTARVDLEHYAQAHGLEWIEDPSNANDGIDRNYLRLHVLPMLRKRWPQADAALATVATLQSQAAARLATLDASARHALLRDDGSLDALGLATLPDSTRGGVLRQWVARAGLPPLPAAGVRRIASDLLPANADSEARFAWNGAAIVRWRDGLHAMHDRAAWPDGLVLEWDGHTPLALPDGRQLRLTPAAGFDTPVTVRARQGGERIQLPGRAHSHLLKHVLQERAVPPWERERMPLLFDSHGVLLAAGDGILSGAFADWLRIRRARLDLA